MQDIPYDTNFYFTIKYSLQLYFAPKAQNLK